METGEIYILKITRFTIDIILLEELIKIAMIKYKRKNF